MFSVSVQRMSRTMCFSVHSGLDSGSRGGVEGCWDHQGLQGRATSHSPEIGGWDGILSHAHTQKKKKKLIITVSISLHLCFTHKRPKVTWLSFWQKKLTVGFTLLFRVWVVVPVCVAASVSGVPGGSRQQPSSLPPEPWHPGGRKWPHGSQLPARACRPAQPQGPLPWVEPHLHVLWSVKLLSFFSPYLKSIPIQVIFLCYVQ